MTLIFRSAFLVFSHFLYPTPILRFRSRSADFCRKCPKSGAILSAVNIFGHGNRVLARPCMPYGLRLWSDLLCLFPCSVGVDLKIFSRTWVPQVRLLWQGRQATACPEVGFLATLLSRSVARSWAVGEGGANGDAGSND